MKETKKRSLKETDAHPSTNQSQVCTQLPSQPAAQTTAKPTVSAVPSSTGWLKADKSEYHKKKMFPCDLCHYKCDSLFNLKTHRNSRRCRDSRPESPVTFDSPPLDPEPYIIRRRTERRVFDVSTDAEVSPVRSQFGGEDAPVCRVSPVCSQVGNETVLPTQDTAPMEEDSSGEEDLSEINLQREAEAAPEAENVYSCRGCEAEFGTVQALMQHAVTCRQIESDTDEEEEDEPAQRQQVFKCGQCDSRFGNINELRVHRRGCHPDNMNNIRELCRNFNCQECRIEPGEGCFGEKL